MTYTPVTASLRAADSHPQGGNASGPAQPIPRRSAVGFFPCYVLAAPLPEGLR